VPGRRGERRPQKLWWFRGLVDRRVCRGWWESAGGGGSGRRRGHGSRLAIPAPAPSPGTIARLRRGPLLPASGGPEVPGRGVAVVVVAVAVGLRIRAREVGAREDEGGLQLLRGGPAGCGRAGSSALPAGRAPRAGGRLRSAGRREQKGRERRAQKLWRSRGLVDSPPAWSRLPAGDPGTGTMARHHGPAGAVPCFRLRAGRRGAVVCGFARGKWERETPWGNVCSCWFAAGWRGLDPVVRRRPPGRAPCAPAGDSRGRESRRWVKCGPKSRCGSGFGRSSVLQGAAGRGGTWAGEAARCWESAGGGVVAVYPGTGTRWAGLAPFPGAVVVVAGGGLRSWCCRLRAAGVCGSVVSADSRGWEVGVAAWRTPNCRRCDDPIIHALFCRNIGGQQDAAGAVGAAD
jgi:hypothetical protein